MSFFQTILVIIIASIMIFRGQLVYGNVAIEVKPIPTAISLVPGLTGFGGGLEIGGSEHWSLFSEVNHVSARLTDEQLEAIEDDGETDAIPSRVHSTLASLGVRYYGQRSNDSWYAGAKLLGGAESARWTFADERLKDSQTKSGFGIDIGYRWLWNSGFLLRLGAGFTGTSTQNREIAAVDHAGSRFGEAETAVLDLAPSDKGTIRTVLDLGLGYSF